MNCAVHPTVAAVAYCRTCGKPLCEACARNVRGVVYCEECIAHRLGDTAAPPPPLGQPVIVPAPGSPSPGLAAVLGFIPGVGAMYNGQFIKALIHVVIFATLVWAAGHGADVFAGLGIPFFIFYMVFDAYKTARARELGLPLPDPFGIERMFGGPAPVTPPPPVTPYAATAPPVSANPYAGPAPATDPSAVPPGTPPPMGFVPNTPPGTAGAPAPGQTWPQFNQALHEHIDQQMADHVRHRRSSGPVGAVILIVLGLLFLLDNMGWWEFRWLNHAWPIFLIAIGVWLLIRRLDAGGRGAQQ